MSLPAEKPSGWEGVDDWDVSAQVNISKTFAIALNAILALACAFTLNSTATSQTFSKLDESTSRTPVKMDPKRPPKIGEMYYPQDSVRHHEEGKCVVRMEVSADGDVLAEQLLVSTGFPHLDSACVLAFLGGHFLPATLGGKPVATWVNIQPPGNLDRPIFRITRTFPRLR